MDTILRPETPSPALAMLALMLSALALTLLRAWWVQTRNHRSGMDGPELLLAAAVRGLPGERRDWGAAMIAELANVHSPSSRWWFALGCARVAMFPPRRSGLPRYFMHTLTRQDPICGILSVALPPLGLPFLYLAAVLVAALVQPLVGRPPDAVARAVVLLSMSCILAGLSLGVAGLVRRERLRWLSVMGSLLSLCIFSYVVVSLHFLDGGD
jgi:hypothetical protein